MDALTVLFQKLRLHWNWFHHACVMYYLDAHNAYSSTQNKCGGFRSLETIVLLHIFMGGLPTTTNDDLTYICRIANVAHFHSDTNNWTYVLTSWSIDVSCSSSLKREFGIFAESIFPVLRNQYHKCTQIECRGKEASHSQSVYGMIYSTLPCHCRIPVRFSSARDTHSAFRQLIERKLL